MPEANISECPEKIMSGRDVNIDLIKVIACYIVIATHMFLPYINNDGTGINIGRLFIRGLLIDGVPLFLICTGCFYFTIKNYNKIIRKLCYMWLQVGIYIIICSLLTEWIYTDKTLVECVPSFSIDCKRIVTCFVGMSASFSGGPHLWYMFTYSILLIWSPLFHLLWDNRKQCKYFIGIELFAFLVRGICTIFCYDGKINTSWSMLGPYFFYVFLGGG